jgi:hypothetical protein
MPDISDQLEAFSEQAKPDAYSNHVDLFGLDELRAHQRGEKVGKAPKSAKTRNARSKRAGKPKRDFTPEQLDDILNSTDTLTAIAERNGITREAVRLRRLNRK